MNKFELYHYFYLFRYVKVYITVEKYLRLKFAKDLFVNFQQLELSVIIKLQKQFITHYLSYVKAGHLYNFMMFLKLLVRS